MNYLLISKFGKRKKLHYSFHVSLLSGHEHLMYQHYISNHLHLHYYEENTKGLMLLFSFSFRQFPCFNVYFNKPDKIHKVGISNSIRWCVSIFQLLPHLYHDLLKKTPQWKLLICSQKKRAITQSFLVYQFFRKCLVPLEI